MDTPITATTVRRIMTENRNANKYISKELAAEIQKQLRESLNRCDWDCNRFYLRFYSTTQKTVFEIEAYLRSLGFTPDFNAVLVANKPGTYIIDGYVWWN